VVTVLVLSLASASSCSNTLQFVHPSVVLQLHSSGRENLFKSVLNGMSPNLWATASSCITDEFSKMTTSSMAKVGTSLIDNRLNAFTYWRGTLLNLTVILSSCFSITFKSIEIKSDCFSILYIKNVVNQVIS
jgi:hypothetical protein